MKKTMYCLAVGLSVLMLGGCGSDENKKITKSEGIFEDVQPHKITKALYNAEDGLIVSMTNDTREYLFKLNSLNRHSQIYIDTDMKNITGYTPAGEYGVGAEYLIEDSVIYKYTGIGGYDWQWELISDVKHLEESEEYIDGLENYNAIVPIDMFGSNLNYFDAQAFALNANWEAFASSSKTVLTREGNEQKYIEFMGFSEYTSYAVGDDELNAYFYSRWQKITDETVKNREYYIDIDSNKDSGYTPGDIENMGAEYYIEGGILYKYTGGNGNQWLWEEIQRVSVQKEFNTLMEEYNPNNSYEQKTIIPKSLIPNWNQPFRVAITDFDGDWNRLSQTNIASSYSFGNQNQVYVYKYKGSRQCEPGSGVSLSDMGMELVDNGVTILETYESNDGLNYLTLCGEETGEINVYLIPTTLSYEKARELGFLLLPQ